MTSKYRYYVIVGNGFPRERPWALVRAWDGNIRGLVEEEFFSPRLVWERSDILQEISRASMNRDEVLIEEREVEHYVEQLTSRFKEHEPNRQGWVG